MWEPILRGKFGVRANDIAMSWLWSRVHERSLGLGYLRGGFQQLYDAFGERLRGLGGQVLTGVSAQRIAASDNVVQVHTDTAGVHAFDRVLATLPTRLFYELADVPEEFVRRYPGPEHYGAHVLILGLDRQLLERVYWLNINDRDLPFLALVEHTNFMPPSDYGGQHLVYLGNYVPMDDPLLRMSESEVLDAFLPALARVRPGFERGWVKQQWMFRAPYAQPIVTTSYLDTLPPHRTPLPGVYLANMAHVYPQDRGQNYSMRLGERIARLMLGASEA
jgi:protoporphyrinogen oxidase